MTEQMRATKRLNYAIDCKYLLQPRSSTLFTDSPNN
jgi:hypothetical protein